VPALATTAALALISIAPGVASASPLALWVGKPAASSGGTSCSKPGYNTVQSAINAAGPGATITVCAGTYQEQLTITKSLNIIGSGSPTIAVPEASTPSTTTCDAAFTAGSGAPDTDGVVICGAITTTLQGLNIDADVIGPVNCLAAEGYFGIVVAGGATLNFDNSSVVGASAVPLNGCQGGNGIEVGDSVASPVELGHLNLINSSVSGYQKNGINIEGSGSTAVIQGATVTGAGPTPEIAQNGIQISEGASGQIFGSTVTGDECNYPGVCGPNGLTQYGGSGVLFYNAAAGTSVTNSTISGDDEGIYNYSEGKTSSLPTVLISADTLVNDRYQGIQLEQGSASVTSSVITGGNVGIQLVQRAEQTSGIQASATGNTIKGESVAAIQVLSDQTSGDKPGQLTATLNTFVGDAAGVLDNSSNLKVLQLLNF
jgi:hypothetical protein